MRTDAVPLRPLMEAIHSCLQGSRVTRTDLSSFSSVDRSCLKRAITAIGSRRRPLMLFVICALAADTQCPMYLDVRIANTILTSVAVSSRIACAALGCSYPLAV